ncbi:isochorismatase family cysteine hydrolase [Metabacillus malikii]|uniref:Nicotinamidase-related amidase n=1 Tax=Metabacillus malikii TaxID=1504265 RepID=A0ABT9ZMT8_9BACI|nr:isochorismatase family cysteine hydrolase [Metabacillus malikii]MDQ0233564.1 nicotinamidase-related amidase [Metabacillus malikii]
MQKNYKYALLIIDMINDFQFQHGPILAKRSLDISESILCLKQKMKERGYPIIYVNDHYQLWQADFQKIAKKCKNSLSERIIHKMYPNHDDYFLIKPNYSAFFETSLNSLLLSLDIRTLIITGIAGNICVQFTANDAYMRGFDIIIPANCCASNSEEDNLYALQTMKNLLKADITRSENI